MSKDTKVTSMTLEVVGYPNYRLYSDGRIERMETGRMRSIVRGRVELVFNGKRKSFLVSTLVTEYLCNPLSDIKEEDKVKFSTGSREYTVTRDGRVWNHYGADWLVQRVSVESQWVSVSLRNNGKNRVVGIEMLLRSAFTPMEERDPNIQYTEHLKFYNKEH